MSRLPHQSGLFPVDDLDRVTREFVRFPYALISLTSQTARFVLDNHVEFTTISQRGDIISLSTGVEQANGIISLTGGFTYFIQTWLDASINEGIIQCEWRFHPGTATVPDGDVVGWTAGTVAMTMFDSNSATDSTVQHSNGFLYSPQTDVDIKLAFNQLSNPTELLFGSAVYIEVVR